MDIVQSYGQACLMWCICFSLLITRWFSSLTLTDYYFIMFSFYDVYFKVIIHSQAEPGPMHKLRCRFLCQKIWFLRIYICRMLITQDVHWFVVSVHICLSYNSVWNSWPSIALIASQWVCLCLLATNIQPCTSNLFCLSIFAGGFMLKKGKRNSKNRGYKFKVKIKNGGKKVISNYGEEGAWKEAHSRLKT